MLGTCYPRVCTSVTGAARYTEEIEAAPDGTHLTPMHPNRTIAAVQSNYIPWKGYFDLLSRSDQFILLDDVQYTKRDWRNRNLIKTQHGVNWLSIPVNVSGRYEQCIKDVTIAEPGWNVQHWKTIVANYAKATYFRAYRDQIEMLYETATHRRLSEVNYHFIAGLGRLIGIQTPINWSMEYEIVAGKTERLVHLCRQLGATRYLSGPRARAYLDIDSFARAGIAVDFIDYARYPTYPQLFPPFEHHVSIIDLIFNAGPAARDYMTRCA